ncbi:MAG: prolyl oligopeptidase family serine peptidase [Verrucomicrobiales bacterium]
MKIIVGNPLSLIAAYFMLTCLLNMNAAGTNDSLLQYPPARKGDVVDDYHGTKVADPYRWMEELDSPETRDWVVAQAKLTDSWLEKIPARDVFRERISRLMNYEKFGVPFRRGNRFFYTHNKGLQPQSVLYMTEGLDGAPKIAFDPNILSTDGSVAVAGYVVSHDGSILAYGLSAGGSDWTDWHFRELATGKNLPDKVRWTKYYQPAFAPDGRGVYYSAFPAPAKGQELLARDLGNAVYYHAFGTPASDDRKIFEQPKHADWQYDPHLSESSQWLVLACGEGQVGDKGVVNVYAIDISSPTNNILTLAEGFDANYHYIGNHEGLLYFQTSLGAPRGKVIAIDPRRPSREDWKTIVPQGPDAMDSFGSVSLVNHQLIVQTLHDAHSQVEIYQLNGKKLRKLDLPGVGTASGFGGAPDQRETFYSYTDLITPATVYRLDLQTGKSSVFRAPKVDFDASMYESRQVFYPGKDGVRIPMYLVHKKGLKLDGENPTLLYGYGGFGISILPRFNPARVAWLEKGGIFAIANIRGGGEYGEEWHRQAIRDKKQVGFDDFIAAAEWLIQQKYTSSRRLAIEGGSNGGLLVGACVTQRPELYGAAIPHVGVMDMLRFDLFGQGAGWVGDFGSPKDPEAFKTLRAYSPYHNVKPGTKYPAMFIVTGDHDTRVMPAHSFKFAAAVQAAQAGPALILLRVQLSSGHGGGATTAQRIQEQADVYAFLTKVLKVE